MLHIGISRAVITPPVGIDLSGFTGRGPSIGIHDPLYTTALVASDGLETVALINCDLLFVDAEFTAQVRALCASRLGLAPQNVMVACTHTHYGPQTSLVDPSPDVRAYMECLKYHLAGAVQEALASRQPALLDVGWGQSDIGINRRERLPDGRIWLGQNPEGPVDRAVGVCRISDPDGKPIGTLVNFATHAVAQSGEMRMISADFPGATRQIVEQMTGAPCLYMQGACGNINPAWMEPTYEAARSQGVRLGCEVVRVWETITPVECEGVRCASATRDLPRYRFGSLENVKRLTEQVLADRERLRAGGGEMGDLEWAERRLERLGPVMESWQSGKPLEPIVAEFQACRVGDLAWATAPGEIFTELGCEVKQRSPFHHTFFIGYTNGSIGYVPVPEAYVEGGYEVLYACQVDPEASRILVETCGQLLEQVKG